MGRQCCLVGGNYDPKHHCSASLIGRKLKSISPPVSLQYTLGILSDHKHLRDTGG